MNDNFDAKGLLQFQVSKDITYLYKRFLNEVEELRNQHAMMLDKLERELPPEYHPLLRASNFFDEGEFSYRRKKVLDAGNDAKRNIMDQLKHLGPKEPIE